MGLLGFTHTEQDSIMDRLERFKTIHVARPEGQQAVFALARKGHVTYRWGEGPDAGIMFVRKSILPPPVPRGSGDSA